MQWCRAKDPARAARGHGIHLRCQSLELNLIAVLHSLWRVAKARLTRCEVALLQIEHAEVELVVVASTKLKALRTAVKQNQSMVKGVIYWGCATAEDIQVPSKLGSRP